MKKYFSISIYKKLIILSVHIIAIPLCAQEMMIDVIDKDSMPISKVFLLDNHNTTLGISNENGRIHFNQAHETDPHKHYFILKKIGYEDKNISDLKPYQKVILNVKSLKEVNITVSKTEEKKKQGIEVIDKCELGKLACCNLAESLENTNSIDVKYADGITGNREIQMLALAGSYSQQLCEGIPYHRGILSKVGLDFVPGPWIESIGISRGIGSVINGYDNISGTLNIEYFQPNKSLDWFVNGYVSEIGKSDINIVKGIKLKENLFTNFFGHTNFSRFTMDNNQDGFSDMPTFLNINLMNKWKYIADNGFMFQAMIQATQYNTEAGQIHQRENYINPFIVNQKYKSLQAQFKTGWELDAVKESSFAILYKFNIADQIGHIGSRNTGNNQLYASITPVYYTNLSSENLKLRLGVQSIYNLEDEYVSILKFCKKEFINGVFGEWTGKTQLANTILGLRADYHNELGLFLSPRATFQLFPTEHHSLKINAGFGFKTPTMLTESFGYLISNRSVILPSDLQAEKAFNAGFTYKLDYKLFGLPSELEAGYYLTLFQNQMIMNVETPELLKIEYLKDKSRAQSFQIDNNLTLNKNWKLRLSYKNDQTIAEFDGIQKIIPLLKTDKFLANLYWASNKEKWRFSTTILINGQARIPNMSLTKEIYSPTYPIVHAQINYVPKANWDFYIGSENIFSYSQQYRIQSFENPNLSSFDAGMIWGPMDVRRSYIGCKMTF